MPAGISWRTACSSSPTSMRRLCGLTASVVDSGMYACIYLDHYDDEIACAGKLLAFCRNNGYRIAGDYLCEVLTEFNVFDGDQRSMFVRLQVPVEFCKTP